MKGYFDGSVAFDPICYWRIDWPLCNKRAGGGTAARLGLHQYTNELIIFIGIFGNGVLCVGDLKTGMQTRILGSIGILAEASQFNL